MSGIITEKQIYELYQFWIEERAREQRRPGRMPKNPKNNKRMWSTFTKLAALLDGSAINRRSYIRASITGIKNCQPGHLVSKQGLDAYEKFHNLQIKKVSSPIEEINRSLNWVMEYCQDVQISFQDYPLYAIGKTKVAIVHLEAEQLSPFLLILHPAYNDFMSVLEKDEKAHVIHIVEAAFYQISKNKEKYLKIHTALQAIP